MIIKYWGDFTCPFTYIGSSNLKKAIQNLGIDAVMDMQAYELNPGMPMGKWETTIQQMIEKDGMTKEEALQQIASVEAYARQSDLPIDFANDHFCSTYNAHRLVSYAQTINPKMAMQLVSNIFHAVMVEGKVICDDDVLLALALQNGLEEEAVKALLADNAFGQEVRAQEKEAEEIPIETIPYFIIDGVVVDSSKTVEAFEDILKEISK